MPAASPQPSSRGQAGTLRSAPRLPRAGRAGQRWLTWLAMAGPFGLIPWAPGTWASLAAALGWHIYAPAHERMACILAAALLFAVGVPAASAAEHCLGQADPSGVVLDEIAGQILAFLLVAPVTWTWTITGLVLFRVFDISKPFPIRRLERLPAGWGIMLDDLLAGLYAAVALLGIRYMLHSW